MKILAKTIGIFLVLFLSQNLFAQRSWQWQNPIPTAQTLYDCKFIDSLTVLAVGEAGTILKSADKGVTWICKSPTINTLRKIQILSPNLIFLGGDAGTVLKSTNMGNSWIDLSFGGDPNSDILGGISFINENTGAIVGINIGRRTTDGGLSWIYLGGPAVFSDVKCLTETRYIATTKDPGNVLFQTNNSGANWYSILSSTDGLTGFSFTNSALGYAYGNNGKIIKTTNGGTIWENVTTTSTINWEKMKFFDEQFGIGINYNLFYTTTNGGANWAPYYSLPNNLRYGMDINANKNGIVVGANGSVAVSNNCVTWAMTNSSFTGISLNKAVNLSDGSIIEMAQNNSILKTTNEGANWNVLSSIPKNLNDIQFIDDNTGWLAAGTSTSFPPAIVYTGSVFLTTNGGVNWTEKLHDSTSQYNYVRFFDNNTGYALCNKTMKTTNGGANWVNANWSLNSFSSILFLSKDSIFASAGSGNNGFIYFSSNAGASWENRTPSGYHAGFTDIKFLNNNTGYAAVNYGNSFGYFGVLYTTNCGVSWDIRYNNVSATISKIKLINQTIFTIGQVVLSSTDQGLTWKRERIPSNLQINYLHTNANNTKGYLFGVSGTILFADPLAVPVGISQNSSITPDRYSLSQNYPNPFNPSTKINYEIKASGFVSIKVFDLLGKEVATLVNEKQSAGSYAVDFNSSGFNLSSGIYFYTLNAGEFKETRKMVLVK